MFYVQIVLALLGAFVIVRGRFGIGRKQVGTPVAPLVGWLLTGPFVIGLGTTILFEVQNALPARYERVYDSNGFSYPVPVPREKIVKPDWLDPVFAAGIVLLAGVLTVVGLRDTDDISFADDPLATNAALLGYAPSAQTVSPLPPEVPPPTSSLPPEVHRYRGAADSLPSEVLALGEADRLHRPWPMISLLRKNQSAAVALGVALFLGSAVLTLT